MTFVLLLRAHLFGLLSLGLGTETSVACRPSPQPKAGTENHAMGDTVTLSDRRPRAEIRLSRLGLAKADVLTLSVTEVHNPRMRPVGLAVGLSSDSDKGKSWEIGHVALFPPDRPGRFTLRVPASVRQLLAHRGQEKQFLTIELLPDSTGGAPDERRVTVGEISWNQPVDQNDARGGRRVGGPPRPRPETDPGSD